MPAPHLVVGLGDSISAGVGDLGEDWVGPSWVRRFGHLVGARHVTNLAVTGHRVADLRRVQLPAAEALRPDVALVSAGGNDLLRASFDPYSIVTDLAAVIRSLTARGTTVVLLGLPQACMQPWIPARVRAILDERAALVNGALHAAVRVAEPSGRALIMDLWADPASAEPTHWHIDRMHPSPAGHEYLARYAAQAAGFPVSASGLAITGAPVRKSGTCAWLIRHGVPWFLRRTVDLIPQMVVTLVRHRSHAAHLRGRLALAITELPEPTSRVEYPAAA